MTRISITRVRRAFTLIELLVVISVIALLIGILLPALSSARATASNVQCSSQVHGIMQALYTYAADNNQSTPVGGQDAFTWPLQAAEPNAGLCIWGQVNTTTNGPIGLGNLAYNGQYLALPLLFCPEYKTQEAALQNTAALIPYRFWQRNFLFGLPLYTPWSAVQGSYDNISAPGFPTDKNYFYNSTYAYRGGDWSYTPGFAPGAITTATITQWYLAPGIVYASPKFARTDAVGYNTRSQMIEWEGHYHARIGKYGLNYGLGDGSAKFMADPTDFVAANYNTTPGKGNGVFASGIYSTSATVNGVKAISGGGTNRTAGTFSYMKCGMFDYVDIFSKYQ